MGAWLRESAFWPILWESTQKQYTDSQSVHQDFSWIPYMIWFILFLIINMNHDLTQHFQCLAAPYITRTRHKCSTRALYIRVPCITHNQTLPKRVEWFLNDSVLNKLPKWVVQKQNYDIWVSPQTLHTSLISTQTFQMSYQQPLYASFHPDSLDKDPEYCRHIDALELHKKVNW